MWLCLEDTDSKINKYIHIFIEYKNMTWKKLIQNLNLF